MLNVPSDRSNQRGLSLALLGSWHERVLLMNSSAGRMGYIIPVSCGLLL